MLKAGRAGWVFSCQREACDHRFHKKKMLKRGGDSRWGYFVHPDDRVWLFCGEMSCIAREVVEHLKSPGSAIDRDGAVFGDVEFQQWDAKTTSIGLDQALLGGPEPVKSGNRISSVADRRHFVWRE